MEPTTDHEQLNALAPGSVIQGDCLLMRTRWGNWVADGGFLFQDHELRFDAEAGHSFVIIYDAYDPQDRHEDACRCGVVGAATRPCAPVHQNGSTT